MLHGGRATTTYRSWIALALPAYWYYCGSANAYYPYALRASRCVIADTSRGALVVTTSVV